MLLSFLVSSSDNITLGGRRLFHIPVPAPLFSFWGMFSTCARIGWVAGYLFAAVACGLLLRLWRPPMAALLLAVCLAVQLGTRRDDLTNLASGWHSEERYTAPAVLDDPGWQTVAAADGLAHLQFLSYDIQSPSFFPLCEFAAQQHWTVNQFYLAHVDVDLLAATIAGQMGELRADTLYAFTDLNDLRYPEYPLHYYRLNGILIGTLEPLELPEAALPDQPLHTWVPADMLGAAEGSVVAKETDGSVRIELGSVSGPGCSMLPGTYQITLDGSGFSDSYVHSGWHAPNNPYNPLDIVWLVDSRQSAGKQLVFQFSLTETIPGWDFSIHALSAEPITVTGLSIKRIA